MHNREGGDPPSALKHNSDVWHEAFGETFFSDGTVREGNERCWEGDDDGFWRQNPFERGLMGANQCWFNLRERAHRSKKKWLDTVRLRARSPSSFRSIASNPSFRVGESTDPNFSPLGAAFGRLDDDAPVDNIICAGKIRRRQSFIQSDARATSNSLLEGLTTTRRRCGEQRPSMRSPLSRWNANFGEDEEKKRHKTRLWGFPKSYGLRPLNGSTLTHSGGTIDKDVTVYIRRLHPYPYPYP